MKIYTKTGDAGETGLFGGPRVGKDDPRVEAYGAVDELNAALGAARATSAGADLELDRLLGAVQHRLFTVGAELATPAGAKAHRVVPAVDPEWAAELERSIDALERELPALRQFILPGGAPFAAALHLARCICRRAERRAVALSRREQVEPAVLVYLNRLSDWLFVAARAANHRAGAAEEPWSPPRR
ncbi:MAG TPA: cob(I)yrinic acid a,c-diamide adenosyltransferase [Anaeromyxobacteraceae bacterium]|jgi:cob(I)alamin adenosyltransferase|nr:cob(I)yrinic acid a,c-diamide adenosyltransferase [Anaeromyxobacteraceae bacterium]